MLIVMDFETDISASRPHQALIVLLLAELIRFLASPFLSRAAYRDYREHAYRTRETVRLINLEAETYENNITEWVKWYGDDGQDWLAQFNRLWLYAARRVRRSEARPCRMASKWENAHAAYPLSVLIILAPP